MSDRIRHSALPKLAICPCFHGSPGENEYTERGHKLDIAFRSALTALEDGTQEEFEAAIANNPDLTAEEKAALKWGVDKALEYAREGVLESREEWLRVATPGIDHVGTLDASCDERSFSIDLKSGQLRGYREQMASYAFGKMEDLFAEEWTMHVLFIDQREVISYRFTYEQAKLITEGVLAGANDPDREPVINDACNWCKLKDECKARASAIAVVNSEVACVSKEEASAIQIREALLADLDKASEFMKAWKIAEKEIFEYVDKRIREKLEEDAESVRGWKLSECKGREFFDHVAITKVAVSGRAGLDNLVLAMGGTMAGKAFREWAESIGVSVNEEDARRYPNFKKLSQVKPKKEAAQKPKRTTKKSTKEEK